MRRGVALPRRLAPFLPLQIPDRMEDPDAWRGPMDHHGQRAVLALYIWTDGFRQTFFAVDSCEPVFFQRKARPSHIVLHERRLWEINFQKSRTSQRKECNGACSKREQERKRGEQP